ncbi:secretion protein HlyD [Niastella yeongjuensis]|uniref:Secretion protein HlyD n=1 Tax=Niastella yeongjuensis TaxID=354355 RepID=A0A1V9EMY1_9BACT|nr:HlyD family secretion protein [Niastella yeongjuensis]OQP47486.1 secretion protein HlyD [Niastella yeongjuensis]SEN86468.1 membrane fusion protein, multidrug efflux system [Niastella yeongjuensis]
MEAKKSNGKSLMNKFTIWVAVLVVVTALVYFIGYILRAGVYEDTNDAQVECFINPVSARAGGFIKNVLFNEHQQVKQGDTLVVLDDREYLQRVREAEAMLEDTRAQQEILDASIQSVQTSTLINKDQITAARARLWQQEQDVKRFRNLLDKEAVTLSDFELVQTKYDVSKSDYSAAINGLKTGDSKVRELQAKYNSLLAARKRAEALLGLARLNLSYTVITSPYSGYTGRKTILEGQQVQAGQPLVSVVNTNDKWVIANFKETQVHGMYISQPVQIEADAIPGKIFNGKIEAISASTGSRFSLLPADNSTGNFVKIIQRVPVKIVFNDRDVEELKAGMNVNVKVRKATK